MHRLKLTYIERDHVDCDLHLYGHSEIIQEIGISTLHFAYNNQALNCNGLTVWVRWFRSC